MNRFQFRLRSVILLTTVVAIICLLLPQISFGTFLLLCGLSVLGIWWSILYSVSPKLVQYLTLFAVIGVCTFSVFSMSILRVREDARRAQCSANLRQLSFQWLHDRERSQPNTDIDRIDWLTEPFPDTAFPEH